MISVKDVVKEHRPSVLVVDDLWSNLELLEAIFSHAGFEVHSALDASSALSIFQSQPIDIAIIDVMMPGMNGFDLCKRIKSINEKHFFPVILLTALTDRQSRITGLEVGADDFISKPFDTAELIAKVKSLLKLKYLYDELEHSENVILTLAVAMEARDPYTRGHSTRVGGIVMSFAGFIGFGSREQEQIRKAGILHDIGKIGLSTALLCKNGRLTEQELETVKQHALLGEDICRPLVSMKSVLPAIRGHHERWDGRGFPDGLKGEMIPITARMLSIVDSFDAIVSRRPYREGISVSMALEIFEHERRSGQWDPYLVDQFISMMSRKELQEVTTW